MVDKDKKGGGTVAKIEIKEEYNHEPLVNINHLAFFGINLFQTQPNNNDLNNYLEEFIIFRYPYFRHFFMKRNLEKAGYFLNLIESNFLMMKSELVKKCILKMKITISNTDKNDDEKFKEMTEDYIKLINYARIIILYFVQELVNLKANIKLENVQKYMKLDMEMDNEEEQKIKVNIMKFNFIKERLPKRGEKIGK